VSIKQLPPESIETFSILLHPKRTYSTRAILSKSTNPTASILIETGDTLMTEDNDYLITES
jgi:hypothetical protein